MRAESSDGARRLWDGDCPARAPSPLAGLGAAASAAPGVRGFLGGRLSLCCEGERHCAAAGGRPLFGLRVSARRAFWRSAAPLRQVTAAPPGTTAVSRKVCACRAFWRSAALPRQGWVSASVWRACARRVFGQSAAPPRQEPGPGRRVGCWWLAMALGLPPFFPQAAVAPRVHSPFREPAPRGLGGWLPRAVLPSSRPAPPSLPSLPLPRLAVRGCPPRG